MESTRTSRTLAAVCWLAVASVASGQALDAHERAAEASMVGPMPRVATVRANSAIDLSALPVAEPAPAESSAIAADEAGVEAASEAPTKEAEESPAQEAAPPRPLPVRASTATDPQQRSALESAVPFLKLRPVENDGPAPVVAAPSTPVGVEGSVPAAPAAQAGTDIPRGAPDRGVIPPANGGRGAEIDVPWYRNSFLALGLVLVLIAVATTIVRRYVPSARPVPSSAMRVVGRLPVSGRQSAVLLQVGRRVLLVGVTSDRIDGLAEFTDAEEVNMLLGNTWESETSTTGGFDSTLASEFGRYAGKQDEALDEPALKGALDEPVDGRIDEQEDAAVAVGAVGGGTANRTLEETKGQLQHLLTKLKSLQSSA